MGLPKLKLEARIGASTDIALRLETGELRFAEITDMTQDAPMRVTAVGHGIPDRWQVAIVDARGMVELNAEDSNDIRDDEFREISRVDANTVEFPRVSASGFKAYSGGGFLAYYAPKDLSGYSSARMDIKDRVGGTLELALDTTSGTLEIEGSTNTLWIHLGATDLLSTAAREYVFDIEMIGSTAVDAICSADSAFTVLPEVTTSP